MAARLVSLLVFLAAGLLSLLVAVYMVPAFTEWQKPFETFEDIHPSFFPLFGASFLTGLVVGSALIAAGWVVTRSHMVEKPPRVVRRLLVVNLVLFALPIPCLLVILQLLRSAAWANSTNYLQAIVLFVFLFAGVPVCKLLILHYELQPETTLSKVFWLSAVLYWPLMVLTIFLTSPLVGKLGWVGRLSAAEGPVLAVILWALMTRRTTLPRNVEEFAVQGT